MRLLDTVLSDQQCRSPLFTRHLCMPPTRHKFHTPLPGATTTLQGSDDKDMPALLRQASKTEHMPRNPPKGPSKGPKGSLTPWPVLTSAAQTCQVCTSGTTIQSNGIPADTNAQLSAWLRAVRALDCSHSCSCAPPADRRPQGSQCGRGEGMQRPRVCDKHTHR